MNIPLNQKLSRNNGIEISTDRRIWNNLYDIEIKFWDDGIDGNGGQNKSMNNVIIGPSVLKVLLVNIPDIEYIIPINEEGYTDFTTKLNSDNTSFELKPGKVTISKSNPILIMKASFNVTESVNILNGVR